MAKINAAGTALLYAGYIGGEEPDGGHGIAVDAAGQAYVVGETLSDEFSFPVAIGPDVTANGSQDGFVAKVNAAGTALLFAGYLGGDGADAGHDIAVWGEGEIFVTGETGSGEATFPVTVGPDLSYNGGLTDAFVAQVRADGTVLDYAGYIGGDLADAGHGIAVDADGQAHVTGNTRSTEASFPVLRGPDLTHNGLQDAFAAKVASGGATLIYAGYVGGDRIDSGNAVALDEHGNAHLTGGTLSTEATFPVTTGPDLTYNGGRDAFIVKIEITGPSITVEGIVNAATFLGGPIAPGEIISIFGVEIGPDPGVNTVFDENGNVPLEFAGVQVLINGIPAPLYYVGENQINCQVPYEVDGTTQVTVQVIFQGTASNIVTIDVADTAPGLFTLENGVGQVIAVLFPEGTLNTVENPVAPGQIVTLYGTGEGQTAPPGQTGVPVDVNALPVPIADARVLIGGVEQTILFIGGPQGFAGLLQINCEIVAGTPVGEAVPIVVIIGGVGSAGALQPEALQPEAAAVESEKAAAKAGGDVTIAITADPDNQGPVANGQMVMTDEDVALPITLTGSDPEGDPLTFTITRNPANGALSDLVSTGPASATVSYSPLLNFNGPDSFEFQVMDPGGRLSRAEVEIEVKPLPDPPVANNDAAVVVRNTPTVIDVLRNDFDPDGDPLTISGVSTPTNGTAAPDGDGILYTPNTDYLGPDGFEYTINDENGKAIDTAMVTILVQPGKGPNNPPIANAQDVMTNTNLPVPITLSGSDPDGDTLTFTITVPPTNGTLSAVNPQGPEMAAVNYTPNTGYDGPDQFTFQVDDGEGGTATAVVLITVKKITDLNITKTVLTSPVIAGQSMQYEVTVNNLGPSDALNVSVTDVIPAPSMVGTLTYNAGLSSAECSASGAMMTGDTVTCTVASIPAGGAQVFTIGFDLSPDAMGTIDNTAMVTSDTPEANAIDNTAAAPTVTIEKDADLQMEKIPATDPVVAGTQVTYTLKVTNQGPSDAESIEVADTFPADLSNPVATLPCVIVGAGPFTWTVGDLAAGAMATCDVTFDIASSATANIANSATVMSTVTPETTNTFPNTAVTNNPVNRQADVVVAKTGPASIILTMMDLFTVTISNPTGPSDVTVQLVDTLPPMFTFVAAGSTLPTPCTQVMQTLTCDPVALPVGGMVTYILKLTAGGVGNTIVTNSATANITDGTETTPADNTDTHDVMLISQPPMIGMGMVNLETGRQHAARRERSRPAFDSRGGSFLGCARGVTVACKCEPRRGRTGRAGSPG